MKIAYILVETRLKLIKLACDNHLKYLPNNNLIIYTHPEHFEQVKKELKNYSNKIILKEACSGEGSQSCWTPHNFNQLLTSKVFWDEYLEYNRVLIFQSDSEILKTGLEEFLEYDFIGAPWKINDPYYFPYVGNGGLSIRNPKIMSKILSVNSWESNMGEDLFFCRNMVNNNIGKLAPYDLAKKFSVESVFNLGTFGAHAIDKWFSKEKCKQIRKQYVPLYI